jgi:ATP-binding cassette subfamily B protein
VFPRYGLEGIGLVAIALLGGILVLQKGSWVAVIPLLRALALGAQRLLPALQQVYHNLSSLKSCIADLAGVLEMLNHPLRYQVGVSERLPMRECIRLQGVHFRYGVGGGRGAAGVGSGDPPRRAHRLVWQHRQRLNHHG